MNNVCENPKCKWHDSTVVSVNEKFMLVRGVDGLLQRVNITSGVSGAGEIIKICHNCESAERTLLEPVSAKDLDETEGNDEGECDKEHCCFGVVDGEDSYLTTHYEWVCGDCIDNYYTRCEGCFEYYPDDETTEVVTIDDEKVDVCDYCHGENNTFFKCAQCGKYIHRYRDKIYRGYHEDGSIGEICEYCCISLID